MIFGAIVAGGIGSRMNISNVPKQFMTLGNKPIIIHTLEKFILCERIDYIYIGVHPSWTIYMSDLLIKYKLDKENIFIVPGGDTRNNTIINIINAAEEKFGDDENHIIVTHDAVRPFVTIKMIQDNIDAALKHGACDTVAPAVDTIVESKGGEVISSIPDRNYLYQGQTPQSFNMKKLKNIYNSLSNEEKSLLTDACKIFLLRNESVYLVKGESSNIKITTVGDYKVAQAMVNGDDIKLNKI